MSLQTRLLDPGDLSLDSPMQGAREPPFALIGQWAAAPLPGYHVRSLLI